MHPKFAAIAVDAVVIVNYILDETMPLAMDMSMSKKGLQYLYSNEVLWDISDMSPDLVFCVWYCLRCVIVVFPGQAHYFIICYQYAVSHLVILK